MSAAPTLETELGLGPLVIGMDEVGRGAIAGPVAVGAVAVDPRAVLVPEGLRDSKLLTERRREAMQPVLADWGIARAVGLAGADEVDAVGIVGALGLAGARALVALHEAGVPIPAAVVLLDGSHDWLTPALRHPPRVVTRTKADRDCAAVAAASVLAKVHRDRLMVEAGAGHPGYDWASNKGYGSAGHFAAIGALGATALHRRSFLRGRAVSATL